MTQQKFSGTNFEAEMLEIAFEYKVDGQYQKAIEQIHKVILSNPFLSEAYEELGDNYMNLEEETKAEKALKQALKINKESSNAHYLLGFLYSTQENWRKALKELEIANEHDPNHAEILRCLGWAYYNANHVLKGTAILERARVLSPGDSNILCDLGVCYMNSFRYQDAQDLFYLSLQIDPYCDQARDCLETLEKMKMDAVAHKLDPRGSKTGKTQKEIGTVGTVPKTKKIIANKKESRTQKSDQSKKDS